VAAVLIAAAFMCLIVFASSVASPWLALRGDPLAPAAAVRSLLPHGILATILLIAGAASVLKTWNVVVLMAARTLLAQSQAGVIPKWFSFVHPRFGSPTNALIFVAATSMIGVFAGRGALGPVVNMSSMCLGAASSLCCAGLIILRKRNTGSTAPPYRVLGGLPVIALASVGTLGMTAMTMIHSAQESVRTIPVEWVLLIIWAGVGTLFRAWTRSKRGRESPFAPP
jgi:APA family basic amino acid/polyamine antiporter